MSPLKKAQHSTYNPLVDETPPAVSCCQFFVPLLLVLSHTACAVMGVIALSRDWSVKDTPCGKSSHIVKHCALNLILILVTIISYFTFPGGGEGARARALSLIMWTIAFLVWGIFLLSDLQEGCNHVFTSHYPSVFVFLKAGMVHNGALAAFVLLHETWLGKSLGYDLTLLPRSLCSSPVKGVWRAEDNQEDTESNCEESHCSQQPSDAEVGQMMAPNWRLTVEEASEDDVAVVVAPMPVEINSVAGDHVMIPARNYDTAPAEDIYKNIYEGINPRYEGIP